MAQRGTGVTTHACQMGDLNILPPMERGSLSVSRATISGRSQGRHSHAEICGSRTTFLVSSPCSSEAYSLALRSNMR